MDFSNPSFSGQGFSTHALSIAQLEFNRKKDVEDDIAAAEAKAAREEANSILNKFLNNVESRIYAQLSKQLVDNMFGICDPGVTECVSTDSGVATVEGAEISWVRDETTGTITLNIVSEDGTYNNNIGSDRWVWILNGRRRYICIINVSVLYTIRV